MIDAEEYLNGLLTIKDHQLESLKIRTQFSSKTIELLNVSPLFQSEILQELILDIRFAGLIELIHGCLNLKRLDCRVSMQNYQNVVLLASELNQKSLLESIKITLDHVISSKDLLHMCDVFSERDFQHNDKIESISVYTFCGGDILGVLNEYPEEEDDDGDIDNRFHNLRTLLLDHPGLPCTSLGESDL